MRDAWSSHEAWVFECLNCSATWDEDLEARHYGDGHGNQAVVYTRGGLPCTTPWVDRFCPKCQSQNVKALSAVRAGHAEVVKARGGADVAMVYHLRRMHAW
ncbi:hypothetical protein D0T12_13970 [Actinomadura spongiicola]|uniref:C2H2-type domain-containing protein n=1 Tax=Actinomadura spongiicola TaxID=2303421 RepID=A0A372GHQ4_9ACTN|nr:hypothetical protein [Actinomadura spongiicola]RFS84649.1 hypothetical protein D0T12_13970 [Actinomadura spongiicola]